MREIIFRGLDATGQKGWVYGDLVHNKKVTITGLEDRVMVGGYEVVPESVGQFTGLCDKNGKEIYEGDILYSDIEGETDIGRVVYNDDFGKYIVVYNESSGNWFDFEGTEGEFVADTCKIIGNIYENSDLLYK